MRRVLLVVTSIFVLLSSPLSAQTTKSQPRPKIALALDAGAANGLAHAGVLQWMDEHHIPVDYIAGTSMGSIIGGAYATGMPASDIRVMISRVEWSTVLRGQTEYRDLAFRRKEDRREYPVSIEFGLKRGLAMAGGLNSGQHVERLINQFALPYSEMRSFDELPVPFRCVATDLDAGQAHTFDQGALADAIRASMSLPGIFEPVRLDGHTFVDGTLLDPLPVGVARKMGADVVIAVYLDTYSPAQEMASPFAVVKRSFQAVTLEFERQAMKSADHVIKVNLLDTDNTEYEKWERIIARGYTAAEQNSTLLLKYQLSDAEWQAHLAEREKRRVKLQSASAQTVLTAGDSAGKTVNPSDPSSLDSSISELEGSGRFSRVRATLASNGGSLALKLQPTEKSYGPMILNPVVVVDGSDYNNPRFSAGGRLTTRDFMKSGGEMRTDLLIGSTNSFRSEMFLPFGRSKKWFTSITALASNSPMDIYFRGDKVSEYRVIESTGGVSAGYTLNRATQLSAGYQLGWMKYSGDVGVPVLPEGLKGWQEIATLRFAHDHRDDAIVPMRGFSAQAAFNYYRRRPLAGEGFPSIELRLSGYRPLGPKQSIYAKAASGSTFGFNDTGLPVFTLGGPSRMAAYGSNEAFMNQYAYARSGYLRQIMSLPPMAGKGVYLDAAVELAKTWHTPTISRVPVDFRVGVIAHTMLGPLEIGAAVGDSGHRKFFFQFGRTF